jgi:tRNA-dihydrouridine synthase A
MNVAPQNHSAVLKPLSIAPMMERTDRHYRYFMRLITKSTLLYTEMVTAHALLHGDREFLLGFDAAEHPVVLQVGGDEPALMADCARIAEDYGYDGININVGCPSSRVQRGNIGACLMRSPEVVARCVEAMQASCSIPVTVKHRIGVDELDAYSDMANFVRVVSEAGCRVFSVHARKAWLNGLSPKENRTVPPLRYADVYRLKEDFPELHVELNGGVRTLAEVSVHLERVDGVMVGRAAYDRPYQFTEADRCFGGSTAPIPSRFELVEAILPYAARWVDQGTKLSHITRHMLNLFAGTTGSRAWKRVLTERAPRNGAGIEVIVDALEAVRQQRGEPPDSSLARLAAGSPVDGILCGIRVR